MTAYQFRLTAVHKLRVAELDRRRVSWAEASSAVQEIVAERAAVERELSELRELQREANARPQLDVGKLMAANRFEFVLLSRQRCLMEQQEKLAAEAEACRLALVEAQREVRALEKLDERQRAEHRQDQARRDVKELDEVGLRQQRQQGVTQ